VSDHFYCGYFISDLLEMVEVYW